MNLKHNRDMDKALHITWLDPLGMCWDQLLPLLWWHLRTSRPPGMLLIHLGENDLACCKGLDLILSIKVDLQLIHDCYPASKMMCSNLLEKQSGKGYVTPGRLTSIGKK